MKITPGESENTQFYFENLFVKKGCKNLIGYTKDEGEIERFHKLWKRINIGDLIIILEGYDKVFGVVEVLSDPFDDENNLADSQSDWFYHRRKVRLIKYFNPNIVSKSRTNRDTILEYSGQGAMSICDEVWDLIREDFVKLKKSEEMQSTINILEYKKQIILQGPPGTGKTRLAKMIADEMIKAKAKLTPLQYVEWHIKSFQLSRDFIERRIYKDNSFNEFYDAFPKEEIKNLTLASYCMGEGSRESFCYMIEKKLKDFGTFSPGPAGVTVYGVYFDKETSKFDAGKKNPEEAIEEISIALSALIQGEDYTLSRKIFRQSLILKILNTYYPDRYFPVFSQKHLFTFAKIFEISTDGLNDIELNLKINERYLALKKQLSSEISNFELMEHLYEKFGIKNGISENEELNEVEYLGEKAIIQFHPAYSYEDFVRGISAETNAKGQIGYKVVNKILADFAKKAMENSAANYVLIIDEINRANLPAVLGELIYALEYRYEEKNPGDTTVESMYALKSGNDDENGDRSLKLPTNLYIIGTMNTADRSVGHIDYAIRRRFAFVDVLPSASAIDEVVTDRDLNSSAKALFEKVSALFIKPKEGEGQNKGFLQADFKAHEVQLGHSYFLVKNVEQLKMKLEYEIKPLLREYVKDGILDEKASEIIEAL